MSRVHATPSSQLVGQDPGPEAIPLSQVSGASTTPLPQDGEQSSSVFALQADGQQPSPETHAVIGELLQDTEQPAPTSLSRVQAMPSSHAIGHAPAPLAMPTSQVSLGSTTPLPQLGEQSVSDVASQEAGQQPSPDTQEVTGEFLHDAEHPEPTSVSAVQAIPSSQDFGQAPVPDWIAVSQLSGGSTVPLPQLAEQSESDCGSQPAGQQPSPFAQLVISVRAQDA